MLTKLQTAATRIAKNIKTELKIYFYLPCYLVLKVIKIIGADLCCFLSLKLFERVNYSIKMGNVGFLAVQKKIKSIS